MPINAPLCSLHATHLAHDSCDEAVWEAVVQPRCSSPHLPCLFSKSSTDRGSYSHPAAVLTARMLLSSARLITPCLLRPNLLDTCPVLSHCSNSRNVGISIVLRRRLLYTVILLYLVDD